MAEIKIIGVRIIETAPIGANLLIVRIDTNQPGLYGYGCATFTQRHKAVAAAVMEYFPSILIGRDALNRQEVWQVLHDCSYWRDGPVLNCALSGVDMALWDIAGKAAGMPVWQLWGGKARPAVPVYRHASGGDLAELDDAVERYLAEGCQHLRVSAGSCSGSNMYLRSPEPRWQGHYFDVKRYMRSVPQMLEHLRTRFGNELELCVDIHERLHPSDAMQVAKWVEPYRLMYLEDALPPEESAWFRRIRACCATPLAMGELFTTPAQWQPLVKNRWIDFIRCHISQIGGVTPARKLAAYCEAFGVRTAWHGPNDLSPIGCMANLHLDLTTVNFGIQEWFGLEQYPQIQEVFQGCAPVQNGFAYANETPGWGIEVDEKAARKYPLNSTLASWLFARSPDGAEVRV